MSRNPWLILLAGAGLVLVVAGLVMLGTAEPVNPFLPVEGRTRGEAQADRGRALALWGAATTLAAVVVTAARWPTSDRVREGQQPEDDGAEHETRSPRLP